MGFDDKLFRVSADEAHANARIKYIPDRNGVYVPHEVTVFPKGVYLRPGFELEQTEKKKPKFKVEQHVDDLDGEMLDLLDVDMENIAKLEASVRRKSYRRAKNNLFDLLTCTQAFDCFITLTLDGEKIDRYDYGEVIDKLSTWLDNRVRRHDLVYALVPEFHKDGAIHFHGLMNFDALKTIRATSPYTGKPLSDKQDRPIYNIADYALGYTTVIPLSGDNARIATAMYCWKYITKTDGEKVGGRYYLSGGKLGRPKYELFDVDYDAVDIKEQVFCDGIVRMKRMRLDNITKGGDADETSCSV